MAKSNGRLTLNLGLRWEIETALTERNDKSVSGFEYGYTQPIEGTVQERYAKLNDPALKALVPQLIVKGGLMFAGVDGPSRLYETPKSTFLPRFGFAYQVNPKTVVRGGAGLFAGFLGQRRGDVFPNGWAQTTTIGTTFNANGAPIPRSWNDALLTQPIMEHGPRRGHPAGDRRHPHDGLRRHRHRRPAGRGERHLPRRVHGRESHHPGPVAILVLFDKRGIKDVDGVPVFSLFRISRID